MSRINELVIDRRLVTELSGPDKIAALLKARGYSLSGYARARGFWPEQVKMAISGARTYAEVRDALASDLGIPREEIDLLIDGERSTARPLDDPPQHGGDDL